MEIKEILNKMKSMNYNGLVMITFNAIRGVTQSSSFAAFGAVLHLMFLQLDIKALSCITTARHGVIYPLVP